MVGILCVMGQLTMSGEISPNIGGE